MADSATRVTVHIGCDIQPWHIQFFELVGMDSSKVEFVGSEPIFAKEVGTCHIGHSEEIVTLMAFHSKIKFKPLVVLFSFSFTNTRLFSFTIPQLLEYLVS